MAWEEPLGWEEGNAGSEESPVAGFTVGRGRQTGTTHWLWKPRINLPGWRRYVAGPD